MSKFTDLPTQLGSPIQTIDETPTTSTFEGAAAYQRDPKSELFLLAVTNMVSEPTFYESGSERDLRFIGLVHEVTKSDPQWMLEFIPWLRRGALMRSASVQAAAEYVKAGGPNGRQVIASTLWRADEPAELVAYWFSRYGKNLPQPVKRGVADAARHLYTEKAALKYDGKGNKWRMADVIQLTHVKPTTPTQERLFKYLLDRRYGAVTTIEGLSDLAFIQNRSRLEAVPDDKRRAMLGELSRGETWEWLSGWVPGGMDAAAWEAVIPHMGYMALLRNLRNFDQAGIDKHVADDVFTRLVDPEQVANSRQFPYRFYSAHKAVGSLRWAPALEQALELSTQNIPHLGGKTVVLTDTSASMTQPVSARSTIAHYEIAALFAAAVARQCESVKLVSWADKSSVIPFNKGDSVLRTVEGVANKIGHDGHGTMLMQALRHYSGEDRVVIFSDMQVMDGIGWRREPVNLRSVVPTHIPVYVFNTGGYAPTPVKTGAGNIYELGGFTDSVFRMIPLVENRGVWPWES